jgi:hypothetical protein
MGIYDYEMEAMEVGDFNMEQGFIGGDNREDIGLDWETGLDGDGEGAQDIYREFEGQDEPDEMEDDREGEVDPYAGQELEDDPQDIYEPDYGEW